MAFRTIDGESLGARHKNLNRLVNEAVKAETPFEEIAKISETSDVVRIFKISVAAKYKNVDYIIENLKCDDLLYASTAINKATWLITEEKYSHIVNPHYLNENVYPTMLTKVVNKFNLAIRLHLKDNVRVENFFNYYKEKGLMEIALKWLINCSRDFKRQVVKDHSKVIDIATLKILCEHDNEIFRILVLTGKSCTVLKTEFVHVLFKDTKLFLDILESNPNFNFTDIRFGRRATKFLVQNFFKDIMTKFKIYKHLLDWGMVLPMIPKVTARDLILSNWNQQLTSLENATKFLTEEDIKMKIIDSLKSVYFSFYDIKTLINALPKAERFEVVKKYIIDNELSVQKIKEMSEEEILAWYRYAPFDVAFTDLKKMIKTAKDHMRRINIISVLVKVAKNNENQIFALMKYFVRMHINEPTHVREMFLKNIVSSTKTHKFEQNTWELLNILFNNLEIFKTENSDEFLNCKYVIIVYNLLHNLDIPNDMIELLDTKGFSGINELKDKLDDTEREIVFEFLLNRATLPILSSPFYDQKCETTKSSCEAKRTSEAIRVKYMLLKQWDKDIMEYPELYLTIRELLLWNFRTKSGVKIFAPECRKIRRLLFDVLLLIDCNEKTVFYSLKHNVNFIQEYNEFIYDLLIARTNCSQPKRRLNRRGRRFRAHFFTEPSNQPLKHFLIKTRVYFAEDLAENYLSKYKSALDVVKDEDNHHESIAHGICLLMERDDFEKTIQKYLPEEHKIDWMEEKGGLLNIRKYFAQFLYKVRPMINLEVISKFAAGDYLQWVKPTLESYFSTIPQDKFIEVIPFLIKGPISLKKICLRFAHIRFSQDEYLVLFDQMWTEQKNPNIRAILFTKLKESLEKETDQDFMVKQWNLLRRMLNELSLDEERDVYEQLSEFGKLPNSVKPDFFMTSLKLLKSLPEDLKCFSFLMNCILNSLELINVVDDSFFIDLAFEQFDELITNDGLLNNVENHTKKIFIELIVKSFPESVLKSRYQKLMPRFFDGFKEMWNRQASNDQSKLIVVKFLNDFFKTLIHESVISYIRMSAGIDMITVFEDILKQVVSIWEPEIFYQTIQYLELGVVQLKCLKESKDDEDEDKKNEDETICVASFCVSINNLLEKHIELYTNEITRYFRGNLYQYINSCVSNYKCSIANYFVNDTSNVNSYLLAMEMVDRIGHSLGYHCNKCEETKTLINSVKDKKLLGLLYLHKYN